MSRSKKIFSLIKKGLPGVDLCKDMLVVFPTEHILRGFLIETTTEKGRVYLWRVVTPLHRPMRSVLLDYSTRIPETGEDLYIHKTAYGEAAAKFGALVRAHLPYLQGVRGPRDFLRHVGWMMGNPSINFRFDLALTYYRVGRLRECGEILQALDLEVDRLEPEFRLPVDQEIKQAARRMASQPKGLAALLDQWETENVERLGLQPSRLVPGAPGPAG